MPAIVFQSTPARGGRPLSRLPSLWTRDVSIHARTRRATPASRMKPYASSFNPRPHAAGDDRCLRRCDGMSFQSTPARGGRPLPAARIDGWRVSIHARTRRATAAGGIRTPQRHVSIHARTRRATRARRQASCGTAGFNPRPHAAGDRRVELRGAAIRVSIHARTRRATPSGHLTVRRSTSFNPRPHAAGDIRPARSAGCRQCFNPRPHAAGDIVDDAALLYRCGFNPRPHAAGDRRRAAPATG